MSNQKAPKRPRHLMDPNNLTPQVRRTSGSMSIDTVQKWVLSVLAAATIAHLGFGLVVAAMYVDDSRTDARIGLNVLAAAFCVLAVVVFRAIHQLKPVSVWLLLGVLPGIIGLWLTFR
jgi:uncharacterized membrane protein YfcA